VIVIDYQQIIMVKNVVKCIKFLQMQYIRCYLVAVYTIDKI
jgi:hypothetical protein